MTERIFRRRIRVSVETVSETFIWSGRDLVIGYDVLFDGGKAFVVDHESLINKLIEKSGLNGIKKLTDTVDRGTLLINFLNKQGIDLNEVSSKTIKVKDKSIPLRKRIVKENIKTKDLSYIPASEVKGVIRTAIINYLVSTGKIPSNKVNKALSLLASISGKSGKKRISENKVATEIENCLWAKIKDSVNDKIISLPVDIFHYLQISDPLDMKVNEAVDSIIVLKKNRSKPIASIPAIVIDIGSRFIYTMNIYDPMSSINRSVKVSKEDISSLYQNIYSDLFKALKYFSKKLIEYEIEKLKGYGKSGIQFIYKLESWKREVESDLAFYFKIGYGTGMYSKTIYLSMNEKHRSKLIKLMTQVIRRKTRNRIRVWDSLTIKASRSHYYNNNVLYPMGWIKVEFREV